MNYALGCAFSSDDLFMNFPFKKLSLSCKQCKEITGNNHRDVLVKKVFKESLKLVLNDIIDNNVTFWLPLTSGKKCCMKMKRVEGEDFKNLRKAGKWKEIDIVTSMFSGYEIHFFMLGQRTPREKVVYLNKELRSKISLNTNKGVQYGDSKNDKVIKDYFEQLYSMFSQVPQQDIDRILNFSWKSLYLHNSYGGDTLITDKDIWCYIGNLKSDPLKHFYYYIRKLTIKLRVIYKRKKIEWDGYYYFALSDHQYELFLQQKNKKGRPRKNFDFGKIVLYMILDECKINEYNKKYIFRVPMITQFNFKSYIQKFITDKAELIITRDTAKFKDITVYENKYEFL